MLNTALVPLAYVQSPIMLPGTTIKSPWKSSVYVCIWPATEAADVGPPAVRKATPVEVCPVSVWLLNMRATLPAALLLTVLTVAPITLVLLVNGVAEMF